MIIKYEMHFSEEESLVATLYNAVVDEVNGVITILADGPFTYNFKRKDIISEVSDDENDHYEYKLRDGRVISITYIDDIDELEDEE